MRFWVVALSGLMVFSAVGCHSHFVEATIENRSAATVGLVQVEYPSASFGVQGLAPGAVFHYRFKLVGSGAVKVTFTDAKQGEHHATGPVLMEGQEGELLIQFPAQDRAEFKTRLRP